VPEPDGGLVAHWKLDTGVLMRAAVSCGSGGTLVALFAAAASVKFGGIIGHVRHEK